MVTCFTLLQNPINKAFQRGEKRFPSNGREQSHKGDFLPSIYSIDSLPSPLLLIVHLIAARHRQALDPNRLDQGLCIIWMMKERLPDRLAKQALNLVYNPIGSSGECKFANLCGETLPCLLISEQGKSMGREVTLGILIRDEQGSSPQRER